MTTGRINQVTIVRRPRGASLRRPEEDAEELAIVGRATSASLRLGPGARGAGSKVAARARRAPSCFQPSDHQGRFGRETQRQPREGAAQRRET